MTIKLCIVQTRCMEYRKNVANISVQSLSFKLEHLLSLPDDEPVAVTFSLKYFPIHSMEEAAAEHVQLQKPNCLGAKEKQISRLTFGGIRMD